MTASAGGRRESVLREMGLAPLWRLRMPSSDLEQAAGPVGEVQEPPATGAECCATASPTAAVAGNAETAPSARPTPLPASLPLAHSGRPARAERIARLDWDELEADIHTCRECAESNSGVFLHARFRRPLCSLMSSGVIESIFVSATISGLSTRPPP